MSFLHKMFRKPKNENKAKLEHKLYLARENPEPVFDLSDCSLRNVPHGIYALCRVFLKEELHLQQNLLISLSGGGDLKDLRLLKILDISNNAFITLPHEIHYLKNLQELYARNNQLKRLPDSICCLGELRVLNVSNNELKLLPESLGDLGNLRRIILTGNTALNRLPLSIYRSRKLKSIVLDADNFIYPPCEIAAENTESIMQYICSDMGVSYIPPEQVVDFEIKYLENSDEPDDGFKAKIWELENLKRQKLKSFIEIEKHNEILHQQEFELANSQKINRKKLLADIAQEQNKLDEQLLKLQHEKEVDRFLLIEQLHEEEQKADIAIRQLLGSSREPLEQLLEQERLEEERFLTATAKYNEQLRKSDILRDMQEILQQETKKFQQFAKHRIETSRIVLKQEVQAYQRMGELLQYQDWQKSELMLKLLEDGEIQKAAVGALLERGDARSWSLLQQVRLVEGQLAALTHIELDRQKLEIDHQMNDLAEKRVNLSVLLTDLLDQQKERRTQLLKTLEVMESTNNTAEDFWLKQYQRLLDKLPSGLSEAQKNIDPTLAQALLVNGVIHCLPFLAKLTQIQCDVNDVTDEKLMEAGIINRVDRLHILEAFQTYRKEKSMQSSLSGPIESFTEVKVEEASAPPLEETNGLTFRNTDESLTNECVICWDNNCEVVFMPCGHLGCCTDCSQLVAECPLCRSDIMRKIRVIVP